MRIAWAVALVLVGCGGESGQQIGEPDESAGTGGTVATARGGSGGGVPVGSAGLSARGGSAGSSSVGGAAGAPDDGDAGEDDLIAGAGGDASVPEPSAGAGGVGSDSEGGAAGAAEEGPELLWSYVVSASSMNPDLADAGDIGGTHRMAMLLDSDPSRECAMLYWIIPAGDTETRVASQDDLATIQDCVQAGNADTWAFRLRDPLFVFDEQSTVVAPAGRAAWVLTEVRLRIAENEWAGPNGTRVTDSWEFWGYPR